MKMLLQGWTVWALLLSSFFKDSMGTRSASPNQAISSCPRGFYHMNMASPPDPIVSLNSTFKDGGTASTYNDYSTKSALEGVQLLETGVSDSFRDKRCSRTALLQVEFDGKRRVSQREYGCGHRPSCARRLLRVDLSIDRDVPVDDWVFDIGDLNSKQTKGPFIDVNAMTMGLRGQILLREGALCIGSSRVHPMADARNATHITLIIGNRHMKVYVDGELKYRRCSWRLFDLFKEPGENSIQIGINRSLLPNLKNVPAHGICDVHLEWMCRSHCPGKAE